MTSDKRQCERVSVSIGIVLDFSSGTREARVSDLSLSGCFVDSIAKVSAGEILSFQITLSPEKILKLSGEVVYVYPNVGFGLRFVHLTGEDSASLEEIFVVHGGKHVSRSGSLPKKESVVEKAPLENLKSSDNAEKTSFEQLKNSIQDSLKNSK